MGQMGHWDIEHLIRANFDNVFRNIVIFIMDETELMLKELEEFSKEVINKKQKLNSRVEALVKNKTARWDRYFPSKLLLIGVKVPKLHPYPYVSLSIIAEELRPPLMSQL